MTQVKIKTIKTMMKLKMNKMKTRIQMKDLRKMSLVANNSKKKNRTPVKGQQAKKI